MDVSYSREQEKLLFLIPILYYEYLHDSDTEESFYYLGMVEILNLSMLCNRFVYSNIPSMFF